MKATRTFALAVAALVAALVACGPAPSSTPTQEAITSARQLPPTLRPTATPRPEPALDRSPTATPAPPVTPGAAANADCGRAAISADGRFVAFASDADNLVPGDTNHSMDVFVHDRQTRRTERASVASGGAQGKGMSVEPAISADGRWVAFYSWAYDLVQGDRNRNGDIFLHDRQTGQTELVSALPGGASAGDVSYAPAISGDGRWVAFTSQARDLVPGDNNARPDVFVYDRETRLLERASVGSGGVESDGGGEYAAISADGRWLAFLSVARNLLPRRADRLPPSQVYLHDRETGSTALLSVGPDGAPANGASGRLAISANGRCVAFASRASNLATGSPEGWLSIFLHDREQQEIRWVAKLIHESEGPIEGGYPLSLSADGRWLAFSSAEDITPDDRNGLPDAFVYDRDTGTIERVSVGPGGLEPDGGSGTPSVSADGRYVAFYSSATNLVPGENVPPGQIYVHDRETGRTELVSVASR